MRLLGLLAVLSLSVAPCGAAVLLSEAYYDHDGGDDTYEWIELVNTADVAVDLTGYVVAWGGTDYTYGSVVLQGQIGPCGTFVVGGPSSVAANGSPAFSQAVDLAPDVQNSGTAADGIALFAPGADVLADLPLDAVVYGPANTSGLIDETGSVAAPEVADAPAGQSVARVSDTGAWAVLAVPTPGVTDFTYTCGDQVPQAARTWSAVKSMYR